MILCRILRSIPTASHRIGLSISLSQRTCSSRPQVCRSAPLDRLIQSSSAGVTTRATELISEIKSVQQGKHVEIEWNDKTTSRFYSLWLHKNCHCQSCRHENGQLIQPSFVLPASLTVKTTKLDPENKLLRIEWHEDSHETILPQQWLKDNSYSAKSLQELSQKQDAPIFKGPIQEYKWSDLLEDPIKVNGFLRDLNLDGVLLVKDVPCVFDQVVKVAELVAPVQASFYGKSQCFITLLSVLANLNKTYLVEAKEEAINVAYTTIVLELHMDLTYFQSPPGLQLLHCIKYDEVVEGGESVFLDSLHVALELQRLHPDLFETLTRVPATFQKIHMERQVPAAYIYRKPHITLNREGKISCVTWSPPFEGPLCVPEEDVEPYFKAYQKFSELINTSQIKVSYRMEPGDCFIFNNQRILHARNEFTLNGGKRLLEGCYVNIDDFKSRVQVMLLQTGSSDLAKRVNNGDWS